MLVSTECIEDGDFVCGIPEEVCVLRYTKTVEDPENVEYKKQLEIDEKLKEGSNFYECFPEIEAKSILEKTNIKDEITTVTFEYTIKKVEKTQNLEELEK